MKRVKKRIIKIIALIFSSFLTFKYALASIFIIVLGKVPLKVTECFKRAIYNICEKKIVQKEKNESHEKKEENKGIKLSQCLESIIDSSLSLCLTASLVNYNQTLVRFTLLICHHIHHSFLSLITDKISDFNLKIEEEYGYFLIWSFIVMGFFGLSFQVAFIIDLINILTLPTKFIYGLLRIVYRNCIESMGKLYEFINKDEKKWITCPYDMKLVNPYFRTSAFGILIIVFHLTIFISFYYMWLALLILLLAVLQNSLLNLFIFILNAEKIICELKEHHKNRPFSTPNLSYLPFLEAENALKIFKGIDLFEQKNSNNFNFVEYDYKFNIKELISTFEKIEKKNS